MIEKLRRALELLDEIEDLASGLAYYHYENIKPNIYSLKKTLMQQLGRLEAELEQYHSIKTRVGR